MLRFIRSLKNALIKNGKKRESSWRGPVGFIMTTNQRVVLLLEECSSLRLLLDTRIHPKRKLCKNIAEEAKHCIITRIRNTHLDYLKTVIELENIGLKSTLT